MCNTVCNGITNAFVTPFVTVPLRNGTPDPTRPDPTLIKITSACIVTKSLGVGASSQGRSSSMHGSLRSLEPRWS